MALDSCTKCSKAIDDKKSAGILCAACQKPTHVKCLSGGAAIGANSLSAVAEIFAQNSIQYFCCNNCNKSAEAKTATSMPELAMEVAEIKQAVNSLVSFVGAPKQDSEGFSLVLSRKAKKTYAKAVAPSNLQDLMYQTAVAGVNNATREKEVEEKRLSIVVVEGLPESEKSDPDHRNADDLESVKIMLQGIGCQDIEIEATERLRKITSDRPAVLKIFLKDQGARDREY